MEIFIIICFAIAIILVVVAGAFNPADLILRYYLVLAIGIFFILSLTGLIGFAVNCVSNYDTQAPLITTLILSIIFIPLWIHAQTKQ